MERLPSGCIASWQPEHCFMRTGATSKANDTSPGSSFTAPAGTGVAAAPAGAPVFCNDTSGSAPSNTAPSLIQVTSSAHSSGDTFPPPRGMSPVRMTSTSRLSAPAPFCTIPVFMRVSKEVN